MYAWTVVLRMRSVIVATLAATLAVAPAPAAASCSLAGAAEPCLTPWLEDGARLRALQPVAAEPDHARADHRVRSLAIVGGVYVTFMTWAHFAWYRDVQSLRGFEFSHESYFGLETYAGGADKLGHAWANLVLGRVSSRLLRRGGWDQTTAAVLGGSLAWTLFLFVEYKDGFVYRFSPGDEVMNTAGAVMAVLLETQPRLDDLLDFRVAYAPSDEYLGLWRGEYHGTKKGNSLNIAEDYSGQTYFLALHLGAVPRPRSTPRAVATALDYLDLGVAFEARKFKPDAPPDAIPTQKLFVGVTVNLQRVFDRALTGQRGRGARVGRQVAHGVFEVMSPPYTILPVAAASRAAPGPAPEQ